ncbi:hypothetical protein GMO_27940 [Gluconobacter morbifer G707]|uniref:Uncharacterized protein n=1 Tax=Gluconobacter morbifer G707 TaxID=1088869 RepID=G6XMS6_9PROT|nr:hypothetical protein GMO_27940 [Gluconobacter morbifer G707]
MNDLEKLLRDARATQIDQPMDDPGAAGRMPRFWPWVLSAVLLVCVSLGIHFFWPVPEHAAFAEKCRPGLSHSCPSGETMKGSPTVR